MKIEAITAYHFCIPQDAVPDQRGEIREKEGVVLNCARRRLDGWGEAAVDGVPFYDKETWVRLGAVGR